MSKSPPPDAQQPKPTREERLAQQLRDNLRRRKAATRSPGDSSPTR